MQTWRDIGNVEAETLVYTLVDTLSETGVKIIGDTQGNVNSKQLTHTMTETLGNSKNRQLSENWPIRRLKHLRYVARTMFITMAKTFRKRAGRNTWPHSGRCGDQASVQNAAFLGRGGCRGTLP